MTPTTPALQFTRNQLSPITATIDLLNLTHNVGEVRRCISPGCDLLAVVKADAYGHGAIRVSQTLANLGIRRFGVATVQEGMELRTFGLNHPILVMGALLPAQLSNLIEHRLTPVISSEEMAVHLTERLDAHSAPYPVHIKVDTGMRRLGIPLDSVLGFLETHPFQSRLQIEGLMTHLADADNFDPKFTDMQLKGFQTLLNQIQSRGKVIPLQHTANSSGILYHQESHLNLVRPGIVLYGYPPGPNPNSGMPLRPVMKVTTSIVQVRAVASGDPLGYNLSYRTKRPSRIAVLPVGYAHGYPRRLSNKGMVLIHGHRVPIVGKICMDMMLVDTTDLPLVQPGDEVVLLGEQGTEEISAVEIAQWAETIPYEILCNFGLRVNRVYEPQFEDFKT
ncbi:MAG: alanine racemase [Nitrospirota bacterium]|nr:MAG: alanine racemase [Nitrospirota bacterium]